MYITKSKLNIFKRSLSYAGALVWNRIPTDVKKCGHIKQFCFEMFKLAKRMECFLIQELLLCHYLHRQMKIYNPCLQMHIAYINLLSIPYVFISFPLSFYLDS